MRLSSLQRQEECGAVLVFGLFLCLIFLAIGALVVDVPRMERVGRLLQRAADAAALAGAAELNAQVCSLDDATTLDSRRICWRRAKRAVIYYLQQNPIYTAEGVSLPTNDDELEAYALAGQNTDPSDTAAGFRNIIFRFPVDAASGRTLTVQITHALYTQAREKWSLEAPQDPTVVPVVEAGTQSDPSGQCAVDTVRCGGQPVYRWANAFHVRLTLSGFSSILAKLPAVGIPITTDIMRESFSAPHHAQTDWPPPPP